MGPKACPGTCSPLHDGGAYVAREGGGGGRKCWGTDLQVSGSCFVSTVTWAVLRPALAFLAPGKFWWSLVNAVTSGKTIVGWVVLTCFLKNLLKNLPGPYHPEWDIPFMQVLHMEADGRETSPTLAPCHYHAAAFSQSLGNRR